MSNREMVIQLLNNIPDSKLVYILDILKGIKGLSDNLIEEVEPDEWDLKMIAEAEAENDGTTYTLDEVLKECDLTYEDLQDWL